ncbi:MAG TPA: cyclic nucleotide-binding domain-containing protein [Mycobacteriales bacterium]|nr:cyclic nucleotide-binding domain-containing protein [Mycobacteriales bacterium]HWA66450.1 cyclic nucleotide-binding domain-containing protein [Mycobacteriales bacterium]
MTTAFTKEAGVMPLGLVSYLRLHHVVTVSTSSFTGMPHADTVVYANDDRRIYFHVAPDTQMHRNISDSRHVSVTIDDYTTDWRKVRELQGVGRCGLATAEEQQQAERLFVQKFGHHHLAPNGALYRMTPSELHFVDYEYATVAGAKGPLEQTFDLGGADASPATAAVATNLDRFTFQPGEVIFQPGHRAGQFFVVLEGLVEIRGEGFGVDQTVVRAGPGELFGDQAALRGQRGALTAHAVERTTVFGVARSALRDLAMTAS